MKRILHIVSHLKKNGTETFIMNIYRAINKSEFQFDFLTFSPNKEGYYQEIIELGGKVFFLPDRKQGFLNYHKELDTFFKKFSKIYDTIHFHVSSFSSVAPLFFAKKYGIPKRIVHVHSTNCTGLHNKILHRINRNRISTLGTDFLGCSNLACKWGYSTTPALKKSIVITNGIDLNTFYPDSASRDRIRKSLNIGDNPLILHVGTFNPIKNHKFLLESFSLLLNKMPGARLACVGDGKLLNEIKSLAISLGINDSVYFLGRRDDIPDLMRGADLFVLPSLYEGLGIVLIEAQACGLTSIASTGVPKETKINDSTSYISLKEGPGKWAEQMISMLSHREEALSPEIFKHSVQSTVNQILSIYSPSV